MLDIDSDSQVSWTLYPHGQQMPARGSVGGTSSKLRDSCHSCAMSKVKCPKEKPACSKCEGRGVACHYILAKRPGRRRTGRMLVNTSITSAASSSNNTDTDTDSSRSRDGGTIQAAPPSPRACLLSGGTIPPASLSGTNSYLGTPRSLGIPTSPKPDTTFALDSSDVFSVLEEDTMFTGLADFDPEVNDMDFIISAMDSPFQLPVMNGGGSTNQPRNDIGSLLIPAGSINHDLVPSEISSTLDVLSASLASNAQVPSAGKPSVTRVPDTASCGCLAQALDLLKMLSSAQRSASDATVISNAVKADSPQTVLMENKQSIEAVSSNLACSSCAGDSFLLSVLSMIVLKILERYATAARIQLHGTRTSDPEADQATRLGRTYNGNRDDKVGRRMAAQLVLSELHRVQRLVNQLSPKLKERNPGPEMELCGHYKVTGGGNKMTTAPFSASTLNQMESDVRKGLSTLSAEIINGLRQA